MDIFTRNTGFERGRLEPIQPVVEKDKSAIHGDARDPIIRRPVRDSDTEDEPDPEEEDPQESADEKSNFEWLDTEAERPEDDSEGGEHHILDFRA